MAPELIRNLPYDCCVDLWSLGVILYELFYGEPPFVADGFPHLMKVIKTHTVSFEKPISDGMRDFLQGLLAKDPRNRLKWPELRQHSVVVADAQPIHSDLSRLYNLGWNDWEGGTTPAVHALDDASETRQHGDAPKSIMSGARPENERNEPPRALVSPVPDPQVVTSRKAGWPMKIDRRQPGVGPMDVVDEINSVDKVEGDDARRDPNVETPEIASISKLQPKTHDPASSEANMNVSRKNDAWAAASQSKSAPDVSSARTAFAQTRNSPAGSGTSVFRSSTLDSGAEAESFVVLNDAETDVNIAAGTDLFNAKLVNDFAPTATQLRWGRVNDAEELPNVNRSAEYIATNPLREYIIAQSSETKPEQHSILAWRTRSESQYDGPPYLHKQFWMALVKAAKTVPLGQQLFEVVVGPCAGACYAMLAANWRIFARGHSRLEPEALVYNLNAASLVVQAVLQRSAPSDQVDHYVLNSDTNGTAKSAKEYASSPIAERNMLICLRTVGIAALRCILFYAHNHSRRHRGGMDVGMSNSENSAADVDGRRLLPCIDAMLKLLCHIVASAGVFLMPTVNGRAPTCWVMGYLVGLPQVLQLYEYHRPLSESFTSAAVPAGTAARGSEHFFALIRSIFTSIDMFSFSSTGVYIQLHRQGTMTFLTACLRRSAKALKHCLAAAESAAVLDEHTKLDGIESDAGLNDTQAQAASLAFAGVQSALVSEIKSQTLVLFELLRPALRSWDMLTRQRGILTPIVEQELELQRYTCLPIEHVGHARDSENSNSQSRGMFSDEILAKKTQIHFRTVKGLVDQLCGAIAAPPNSRRQLDSTVSERPCLLVVCRALHAMLHNAETQLSTTLSARVLPLSPNGLGELVELLASVDATLGLVLCCAEHSLQCARILMQSTTLLSIVDNLSGCSMADSTPWDVRKPVKAFGSLLSARLRSHFRLAETRSEQKAGIEESKSSLSQLKRRQNSPSVGTAGSRLAAARNALGVKRAVSLLEKMRAKGPQLIACLLRAGFDELANAPQVSEV